MKTREETANLPPEITLATFKTGLENTYFMANTAAP